MTETVFTKWLDTFIEEKELDIEGRVFEITDDQGLYHFIPCEAVIEYIKNSLDASGQAKVKTKIVYIDYKNGDVFPFFEYIAKFMANTYQGVIRDV